ncbi:NitT/TauT family transport system ATP-binding protein [Modicisalibacter ilicicola DSM 19980]|uniref:NitT/TauT family transport system ATP-binding protein n=1 Tax=Modicisalibacter ilicicola DSM 19980 TaxID=1121942 RepID=A0A1M4W6Y4_9GAMM|nr:ABC transporter ATP-binding protein [Halomonas ilicicola]SHE76910.1 NitT/TauT family transport system ATP-binding protein [Halomonas ilicicola DSM 19980]
MNMLDEDRMAQSSPSACPPPTDTPKLRLANVSKSFHVPRGEAIEAIKDVSFTTLENEVCVLLGPSGCGKSTVLRMVAGLEQPSSGELMLDGCPITGPSQERGMVFQAYTSFDWLTVQQNVEYGMRLNHVPKAQRRERARHFIELVGLSRFAGAYPRHLSGGMKQRVAIARTLANEPAILLMDEPFGALDAQTRWQMQELMMSIVESANTTILMVTHDIEEAIFLADRIEFMSRHPGRVHEEIIPSFKQGRRLRHKEELIGLAGYGDLERHILHLMRAQGGEDFEH